MQNNRSVTKSVFGLIIICLIVMGSVFYYRYQHQQKSTILSNDHGVMFSVGRDLKPISLNTDNKKFTERDLNEHWTLMFFGFTHCAQICPTTMKMLSEAYPILHKQYQNLQVVMVSLDPERDTSVDVNNYAKRFYPEFIGTTSTEKELHKLQSQLGVSSQRGETQENGNYQIMHTSSIMLINPKGQWVGMFKYGLTPQQFIDAYQQTMRSIG